MKHILKILFTVPLIVNFSHFAMADVILSVGEQRSVGGELVACTGSVALSQMRCHCHVFSIGSSLYEHGYSLLVGYIKLEDGEFKPVKQLAEGYRNTRGFIMQSALDADQVCKSRQNEFVQCQK